MKSVPAQEDRPERKRPSPENILSECGAQASGEATASSDILHANAVLHGVQPPLRNFFPCHAHKRRLIISGQRVIIRKFKPTLGAEYA